MSSTAKKNTPSKSKAKNSSKSRNESRDRSNTQSKRKSSATTTIDHEEIRRWVEDGGGHPATVKSTAESDEPGILRIDFPDYSGQETLEPISWDDFFAKFEESQLAFLYQERTQGGKKSRFSKLVRREA